MNHKAIVVKQLHEQLAEAKTTVIGLELAIKVLGGVVGSGTGKAVAKQSKGGGGGWPKGKPRGPKKAPVADPVTGLTPIQKAQAARKAKLAAAAEAVKNSAAPQGADLGAAAAT